ncbi:MAG: hypothetical protein LBK63_12075 [Treponema sp.]|jgi:hypothetical protein|nr:hypothetical protein [Treponema sp.]
MTKKEIVGIIDLLDSGGFEVQKIEQGEFTGDVSKCPSYWVRFQRKADLEKERAANSAVPFGEERPGTPVEF